MNTKLSKENINIFSITVFITLLAYSLSVLLLIYITFTTSFKDIFDMQENAITLPTKWVYKNYIDAFTNYKVTVGSGAYRRPIYLAEMFLYSFIYSIGCAFFSTIVPCIVAYLIVKYNVFTNKIIYTTVIISMVLPIVGALPSEVMIAKELHLYDSIFGTWVMSATYLGTYFLVYYATFKGLSNEYMEAAFIDGASHVQVLFSIVIPLVKTTIFAIFILQFISYWNNYQVPIVYLPTYPTAAVGLFKGVYHPETTGLALPNIQMAGCMILFIPILILFLSFKNIFMGNLTVGGIKG